MNWLHKGGTQMFNYISTERKLHRSVKNDVAKTYRHSPSAHLKKQATFGEQKWHRARDTVNQGIYIYI